MRPLTENDIDDYLCIKGSPGGLFAGQFPDDVIARLEEHGLVKVIYGLILSRVYAVK